MRRFLFLLLLSVTIVLLVLPFLPALGPPSHRLLASPSLHDTLPHLRIVPQRARVLGYERDAFGEGWQSTRRAGNIDACTTRQHLLLDTAQGHPQHPARWEGCQLRAGTILDPYSGQTLRVDANGPASTLRPRDIDIDHIFPLSAAWDLGAHAWPRERRIAFANDPANLVPTLKKWNREKSDALPSEWLPPDPSVRCDYARRVAALAVRWELALSSADVEVIRRQCWWSEWRRTA